MSRKKVDIFDRLLDIGGETVPSELLQVVEKIWPKEAKKITLLDAVIRSAYFYALKGETWAVQWIAEQVEKKENENNNDFFFEI